jgi:predicted RNA-binding Zn ribbon-like protein
MKRLLPVIEPHSFADRDFIGGDAALDFVNTVTGRDESPRDWLDSYGRLLDWATRVRLLPERNLKALRRKARSNPAAAGSALAQAKALRESLFALISAIVAGAVPPRGALELLRQHWVVGIEAHALRLENSRVVAEVRGDAADLNLVAALVAYRMVQHVLPTPTARLRICRGENCSWVFVDSSKAGARRWCDMAVCGNAAKSKRFYARTHPHPSRSS